MTAPNGIAPDHPGPEPPAPHQLFDTILVLDFGSQYTHLITRRLRELNIYSELLPCTQKLAELDWKPKGVILSGGPYSVYAADAPHVDPAVFELGVPILGICYGLQEMAWHHGKDVAAGEKKEYGRTELNIQRHGSGGEQKGHVDTLFANWEEPLEKKKAETKSEAEEEDDDDDNKDEPEDEAEVWMSHGDKLSRMPDGFVTIATTANAPFAGIAHVDKPYYGIQFHPEVTHTPRGTRLIRNFAVGVCGAQQNWTMESFVDQEIERIRKLVGEKGQVLGAVSGGVDSTVAAKLMQAAIGDRFHAVLVDNGVMRLNEAKQVEETLTRGLGINLTVVDASELFLSRLAGVSDPEKKRKIIGNTFIDVFQEKATEIAEAAKNTPRAGDIEWFLQGTLYPDVIESISFKGPSATIKTHHNVGGLPEKMRLKLIEPLRELFKDEVRALGRSLGIPEELVMRHPFPGPGIAIRVIGEVTPERIRIAQKADKIFIDEIRAAGLYGKISQAFAGVFGVKSVGVVGDQRLHGDVIALRAVRTTDFMTAKSFRFKHKFLERVSNRIANEVDGVARVFYETTSKPPATIELE